MSRLTTGTPITDRHGDVWTPNSDGTYQLDGGHPVETPAEIDRCFGPIRYGAYPGERIPSIGDRFLAVANHIDAYLLGNTRPTLRTFDGIDLQVFNVDGHAIPVITRWARSLGTNQVTVDPGPTSTHLTTRGQLADNMPATVAIVATDTEHAALHDMAITGPLDLDQLARFARDEDTPPRKHVLSADCWCNPDVTLHSVRHHGDTTTGWLTTEVAE